MSQQWRCEADALADLQAMSSSHASAAAARESIERGEKRAPVRLQTSVGRGSKSDQMSSDMETDPWCDGSLANTSPYRSPQGVNFSSPRPRQPMGRAKMIAEYISEAGFDSAMSDLQREVRKYGINGEHDNSKIRYHHQQRLERQTRNPAWLSPMVTPSDSDGDSSVSTPKSTASSSKSSDFGSPTKSPIKAVSYEPVDFEYDEGEFPKL